MAARSFDSPDRDLQRVVRLPCPAVRSAFRHILRNRVVVVASCPATVVRFAGGWLCDHVLAGWEATAVLVDDRNALPLRILGAHTASLEAALPAAGDNPRPHAVAVEAELYMSDARVRQAIRHVQREGVAEVQFWGDSWPADLEGYPSVRYQVSVAARAFKAQALAAAAGAAGPIAGTETFRTGEPPHIRPMPGLVSAS